MAPSFWREARLGEIVTLKRGYDLPSAQRNASGGIPVVSSSGVTGYHDEPKVQAPGVVTGRYGTVGKVFYIEEPFWPLNTTLYAESFHGNDQRFVYHFLQTINYSRYSDKTGVPGINRNDIHRIRVAIPPLPEQRKIAEILGTWDEAIDLTERRIAAARRRKKGLMQQLLTGRRRFKEFEEQPWREERLGELGETYSGLRGKSKESFGQGKPYVPYLNIYNNARLDPTQMDYVEIEPGESQNRVHYGDIFFTTSSETPDEVGMSAVLLDEIGEAYLNSFCYGFRLKDFTNLLPEYAVHLLRGGDFRHAMHYLAQGATRFNLTKRYLLAAPLRLPPLPEQRAIACILRACDREIHLLNRKRSALQEQKKGLMQRLLTGRVRLKSSATGVIC